MENKGKSWRCLVCGYIHYGDAPPIECPVCGASANEFESVKTENPTPAINSSSGKIIIAGAGIAGLSAAEAAREAAPEAEIILLASESEAPYYRMSLTRFLADEISADELPLHPSSWYAEKNISLKLNAVLKEILPAEKTVKLENGQTLDYNKLIITTGASPYLPQIPGIGDDHVFTLRTIQDAENILAAALPDTAVAIIGGGILGLETAGALAKRGANVMILEAFSHLMPRQLNEAGSHLLQQHLTTLNIEVVKNANAEGITKEGVQLKDGRFIAAETVIVTAGVRSNLQTLAALNLPSKKGVLVDNFMRTSNPDILAAGDVCEHDGVLYGSWAAAQYQGKIAGLNAAGTATEFGGIPRSHMLKILGKDMASIGLIHATDGSFKSFDELDGENYRMLMVHDEKLVGALLVGDLSLMTAARTAIESGSPIASGSSLQQIVEAITPH